MDYQEVEVDLLAGLRDGTWLDAQDFPPLVYQVEGIVPEGMVLLVGAPKIGKSWFVLGVALAVAHGGRALGQIPVKQRPVFYLALEDGDRRLQDRCRKLLARGDVIPEMFNYMTAITPGSVLATIDKWLEDFGQHQPLVILDTLGKVMPPSLMGESAYQRDYRIGGALKRIVDRCPGSSLLVNHHDRKAGAEDFVDAVSGTHGLAGSADTIIVLSRNRHEPSGLIKVTGRDVVEGEYALRFDESAWSLDGKDLVEAARKGEQRRATADLSERTAEIYQFVSERPTGVRAKDVAAEFGDDAPRYLQRLAEAGKLVKPQRGLYLLPTSVSEPSDCPNPELTFGQSDTSDSPL
jgi:RecA-family ATPase